MHTNRGGFITRRSSPLEVARHFQVVRLVAAGAAGVGSAARVEALGPLAGEGWDFEERRRVVG